MNKLWDRLRTLLNPGQGYKESSSTAKNGDFVWLGAIDELLSDRIPAMANALSMAAIAVEKDLVSGWQRESEIMQKLGAYEKEYEDHKSLIGVNGRPRSPDLRQSKKELDAYLGYCKLAFYWGKIHYQDASGAPGERARYETGMAKKAAVRRVANSGSKFVDNAFKASRSARSALVIVETVSSMLLPTIKGDKRIP